MDPLSHQLFVNNSIIADAVRLERRYKPPHHFYGPVIRPEHPWEGAGVAIYGTVMRDENTGRFQMWYLGYSMNTRPNKGLARVMNMCYAESDDGIHWEKPNLGLVEWKGSKDNNIVTTEFSNPTVIRDDHDPDPQKRYKFFQHGRKDGTEGQSQWEAQAHWVRYSPDGFQLSERHMTIDRCGDRHNVMYDPRLERPWVYFTRPYGYWQKHERRMVARLDSKDLVNWSDPIDIIVPDFDDSNRAQFYSMYGFPYGDQYLGFLQIMDASTDRLSIELVSSPDSFTWERAGKRVEWATPEMAKVLDATWLAFAHNPPLNIYGDLYMFYDIRNGSHIALTPGPQAFIGLAVTFEDRFAAIAADLIEGRLTTIPFTCPGGTLKVNTAVGGPTRGADGGGRAGAGYTLVEILDENGEPIPGFDRDNCIRHWDDFRKGGPFTWTDHQTTDALKGRTISLKFYMTMSDLYSFWFDNGEKNASTKSALFQPHVED
jgi:hypothetical protein